MLHRVLWVIVIHVMWADNLNCAQPKHLPQHAATAKPPVAQDEAPLVDVPLQSPQARHNSPHCVPQSKPIPHQHNQSWNCKGSCNVQ